MRSLTRDPGLADPGGVPPWTVFTADPDPRLRHAALAQPGRHRSRSTPRPTRWSLRTSRQAGLLDTAVVVITFDNGAGRYRRGELLGRLRVRRPRRGLRLRRHGDGGRRPAPPWRSPRGVRAADRDGPRRRRAVRRRLHRASSSSSSPPCARGGTPRSPARDARRALAIALASIESVERTGTRSRRPGGGPMSAVHAWPSAPRWCSPTCRSSSGCGGSTTWASRWRSGTGRRRTSTRSRPPAPPSPR